MTFGIRVNGSKYNLINSVSDIVIGTYNSEIICKSELKKHYAHLIKADNSIVFDGIITKNDYLPDTLSWLANNGYNDVNIIINSQGGDFLDAIDMHNQLRNSTLKVNTYLNPFAFSAAAVLALAGDKIFMPANGMMMFHVPKVLFEYGATVSAEEMEKHANSLRKAEQLLINTIMSKTKKTQEECEVIIRNDTYFLPEEALEMGIIDEIIPIYRDVELENSVLPPRIMNFIKESKTMPLKEVCETFGLTGAKATEENLIEYINSLQTNQAKQGVDAPKSIVNLVKNARESSLDQLVSDGYATPAMVNQLKVDFCSDARIQKDIQNETDDFTVVVNALKKNDKIINFQSKTTTQVLTKEDIDRQKNEENLARENMKKRGERHS